MIEYRGFEIHVDLADSIRDLYDVAFQIKDGDHLVMSGKSGARVVLRNGPFTRRWGYLIAEIAGQAAIDVLLGPENDNEDD